MKGKSNSEVSGAQEKLKIDLGTEILKQKIKIQKSIETAEKLGEMNEYFPTILDRLYCEDKMRMVGS